MGSNLIRRHKPDYLLMLSLVVLIVLGLVIIYSISPVLSHKIIGEGSRNHFLFGQLLHVGVGIAAFLFAANLRYQRWQGLLPVLIIASALALLLLMIPGVGITKNGATRWIGIGDMSFQPAELIKFTLLVYLAQHFARLNARSLEDKARTLWPIVAVLGVVSMFVLFAQRDMGTTLVMGTMIIGIFFASGVSLRQVGSLLGIGLIVGIGSILLFPHRIARIATFLRPDENVASGSYHLNQALIAIGSGGLFGLGLGKSVQIYGYLPEAANDSIFAIIAETFGFLGSLIVFAAFGLFLYRGYMISMRAPDRFGQLLAIGVVLWVSSQAIINMAAMLGIVPLTGIPLPFLSYGGTSLTFVMAAAGILVNISKYGKRGAYADSTIWGRNRRTSDASLSRRPATAKT